MKLNHTGKNQSVQAKPTSLIRRANRSQSIQIFLAKCTAQEANDELHDNIKQSLTHVLAYLMQKCLII